MAVDEARAKAHKELQNRLEREIDPVFCPHCGWMQKEMIVEAKRRRCRWLIGIGIALTIMALWALVIALGGAGITNMEDKKAGKKSSTAPIYVASGVLGIGAAASFLVRRLLQNRVRPNALPTEERLRLGRSRATTT